MIPFIKRKKYIIYINNDRFPRDQSILIVKLFEVKLLKQNPEIQRKNNNNNICSNMKTKGKKEQKQPENFKIKAIVGFGLLDGHKLFKIHWEGYSLKAATWEPLKNFATVEAVFNTYYQSLDAPAKQFNLEQILPKEQIEYLRQAIGTRAHSVSPSKAPKAPKTPKAPKPQRNKSTKSKKTIKPELPSKQVSLITTRSNPVSVPSSTTQTHFLLPSANIPIILPSNLRLKTIVTGVRNEQGGIELLVSWEENEDGTKRADEFLPKEEIARRWPEKLMAFYENAVKWV